jgi:fructose-bisphosphate aldolase class I
MDSQEMSSRIREANGFIAALDQSGGSTPKALAGYGVAPGSWADDAGMFELIHRMRCRIITSPAFNGDKVLGAILFERTMDGSVDGKSVPQALIDRGVIPFLKVDQGLEEERDGVQLMKPIAGLEPLLARAKDLGVFGTKMRSVIKAANRPAIARIVAQQIEIGRQISAAGLMPILEPEYDIGAGDRATGEAILLDELTKALAGLPSGEQVMLKLSIPAQAEPVQRPCAPSRHRARRGAFGGIFPGASLRGAGKERGHDRQLQPGAAVGLARHDG